MQFCRSPKKRWKDRFPLKGEKCTTGSNLLNRSTKGNPSESVDNQPIKAAPKIGRDGMELLQPDVPSIFFYKFSFVKLISFCCK